MPRKATLRLVQPTWLVYCITHVESGVEYFGVTNLTLNARWQQHVLGARRKAGTRFLRAVREFGPDAFRGCVLIEGLDEQDALSFESTLITSKSPDMVFNEYSAGGSLLRDGERKARGEAISKSAAYAANRERLRRGWADPEQRAAWLAARKPGASSEAHRRNWMAKSPEQRAAQLSRLREGRVKAGQVT